MDLICLGLAWMFFAMSARLLTFLEQLGGTR